LALLLGAFDPNINLKGKEKYFSAFSIILME